MTPAVMYEHSSKMVSASMLFTMTDHPTARAAAGTSYCHMTIRIGRSLVEDDINSAVETEFPLLLFIRFGIASDG